MNFFVLIYIFLNIIIFISLFLTQSIHISLAVTAFFFFLIVIILRRTTIVTTYPDFVLRYDKINNSHYYSGLICLIIFVILEQYIGFNASLFVSFLIFSHLNQFDSRSSFFLVLIFLALTAFFTAGRNSIEAEKTAILAYYFLFVGVMWYLLGFGSKRPVNSKNDIIQNEQKN